MVTESYFTLVKADCYHTGFSVRQYFQEHCGKAVYGIGDGTLAGGKQWYGMKGAVGQAVSVYNQKYFRGQNMHPLSICTVSYYFHHYGIEYLPYPARGYYLPGCFNEGKKVEKEKS